MGITLYGKAGTTVGEVHGGVPVCLAVVNQIREFGGLSVAFYDGISPTTNTLTHELSTGFFLMYPPTGYSSDNREMTWVERSEGDSKVKSWLAQNGKADLIPDFDLWIKANLPESEVTPADS